MKKTYFLLILGCALMACKKNNVDFSYSPSAPRAGESVVFTNHSSSGEEWSWTFGDGALTTLKSPSHIYKQPGTYSVTLQVDKKSSWTATKQITVYDTVPTFTCADTEFEIFRDYTFTANVYNPYNYEVSYEWSFPLNTPYVSPSDTSVRLDGGAIRVYFTCPLEEAPVWLRVVLNGDTTLIRKTFRVKDRTARSVLMRTSDGDYRQRIFADRAETAMPVEKDALLTAEQDTVQTYNGRTFRLDSLADVYPGMKGFHIAARKLYYRADGLWVANLDGSNREQIDAADCAAMTLDTETNRIYWANAGGVWYMPFVGSANNKFVTTPTTLNTMGNVTKIAIDNTLR